MTIVEKALKYSERTKTITTKRGVVKRRKPGLADQLTPELVEALARKGMNMEEIGKYFGCTLPNVSYAIRTNDELKMAWNRGMRELHELTTSKLVELIEEKNLIAILFTLKCRFGWRETGPANIDDAPRVNIFLPSNKRETQLIEGEKI